MANTRTPSASAAAPPVSPPIGPATEALATREFRFTRAHFDFIATLLFQLAGIHLAPHKQEMMYSRLARRLRELQLGDFDAYCALLESEEGTEEVGYLVNALTTNLTSFYREPHHFQHLAEIALGEIRAAQADAAHPRLRIWSAGCSSGPEPYTIAMVLNTAITDLRRWDARILATDIDTHMIETGRQGFYPIDFGDGIPVPIRDRLTRRMRSPTGEQRLAMNEELRRLITFKPLNLLEPWPMKGPFHAIFCRNVLIYFDRAGRTRVIDRFAELLARDGYLYLGHSESLNNAHSQFRQTGPTIYRRTG